MAIVRGLLISLLLVGGVYLGLSAFYLDLHDRYGTPTTELVNLNRTAETLEKTREMQTRFEAASRDPTAFVGVLATGAIDTLILMFSIPNIVGGIISNAFTAIGLPSWVMDIAFGIILIIILMAVLKGIMKVNI